MVTIRLARAGVKKRPFYNVRVADSRRACAGAFLEKVGYFNPGARGREKRIELDMERIKSWLALGAQPSDRVKNLIRDYKRDLEAVPVATNTEDEQLPDTDTDSSEQQEDAVKEVSDTSSTTSTEDSTE